jgi:cell division protein ZapE
LKKEFLYYCTSNKFEQNTKQIKTLELLINFYKSNFSNNILLNIFRKKNKKLGFYLHGDVGVGKTMILDFFFNKLNMPKLRIHFNEFMINFHNFRQFKKNQGKDNSLEGFVRNLKKKADFIYLDEFQVTNIVDAMI